MSGVFVFCVCVFLLQVAPVTTRHTAFVVPKNIEKLEKTGLAGGDFRFFHEGICLILR